MATGMGGMGMGMGTAMATAMGTKLESSRVGILPAVTTLLAACATADMSPPRILTIN